MLKGNRIPAMSGSAHALGRSTSCSTFEFVQKDGCSFSCQRLAWFCEIVFLRDHVVQNEEGKRRLCWCAKGCLGGTKQKAER